MFTSIRTRLLVAIVLIAVTPQLIAAISIGQRINAALEQQVLTLQRRVTAVVGSEFMAYVEEHNNELVILEEVNGLGTLDIEDQQTILKNLLDSQRVYHELILVDQMGQEQIHLSRTDVILKSEFTSRADSAEFLIPIRSGETYFGPVIFDDALREPLMTISIPLFDQRQGNIVAVLIAKLRFKPVWDLLANLDVPNNGDAYILSQTGQVLAHRSPDIVLSGRTVNFVAEEGRGVGLNETDVFFVSQALALGEQKILIVAEQPAVSALELARTNNRVYLTIVTASMAVAIILAVIAARQITFPVEKLAAAARSIESGDFSVEVEIAEKGEIADLARAFSSMKSELQRMVLSLQKEVIERKHAEAALQVANERLQELDQMKSKFIDDLSHEIRTPLTNIKLYLELLASGKPESRAKYEAILKKESERLVSLSNGVLDFSDQQKSLDKAPLIPLNLNALVAEVVVAFEQLALGRGLELSFNPGVETLPVWGNAEQLKQVVVDLLKNAINYTPSGHVHISTYQMNQGDSIRLTIEDSGMGLDEEELAHCFERFYRGKRVGQYNDAPGAGLGLAKVKDIVAFHKGRVEVESEVDRGTVFSVYLLPYKGDDLEHSRSLLHVSQS